MNQVEYPKHWNMSKIDLNQEMSKGSSNYAKPQIIQVNLHTSPGKDVAAHFKKTCSNKTIVKIESVQNQMLYDSFWAERRKLIRMLGEKKINERDVFHGTRQIDVMKKVYTQGFMKVFNNTAAYGQGTYFARDASYSANGYCGKDSNGVYQMFYVKAIMGESHVGKSEYKLTSWPQKSHGVIYDSLVNTAKDPSIFVLHQNARAYPMFIIHFK